MFRKLLIKGAAASAASSPSFSPHPGCRPHTYRPHLCSSPAHPALLPPTELRPAPVGMAWPPKKPGSVSTGTSHGAGGVCLMLPVISHGQHWCHPWGKTRPWGPLAGGVRQGCFSWCSGAALGAPEPTCPTGSQNESFHACCPARVLLPRPCPGCSPSHCGKCQGSLSASHPQCLPVCSVLLVPPHRPSAHVHGGTLLCTHDHPWVPPPRQQGKARVYLGRKVHGAWLR